MSAIPLFGSRSCSATAGVAVILATAVVSGVRMLLPDVSAGWFTMALLLFTAGAVLVRSVQAIHLTLFCLLLTATPLFLPPKVGHWPYKLLLPLTGYALLIGLSPRLRRTLHWMRRGQATAHTPLLVLATVLISSGALLIWYYWAQPNIAMHTALLPARPIWLLLLSGMGFALFNAAMEEAAFRGIILEALDSALGPGPTALTIQAALFASAHFVEGFPNGFWGLSMTFVYGLMLGALRRHTKGLLAPWIAHLFADFTIFAIVAGAALSGYTARG
jgi:membrane protease YdiL (CAAX protease family)